MQNHEIETERRFLLKYFPSDLENFPKTILEDVMILTQEPHPHLRLRHKKDVYVLTKKYPKETNSKLEMVEETIVLNEIEFNTLKQLPHTGQKKIRYNYKYKAYESELDLWLDDLQGLAIFEVEFASKEASEQFEMPSFCLIEVTGMEWLAGGMLSGKKFADLEASLAQLGYQKLTNLG